MINDNHLKLSTVFSSIILCGEDTNTKPDDNK